MNVVRLTIISDAGTVYSWLETEEHWGDTEFLERFGRSPGYHHYNKEQLEDSACPMYGALEALGQSDECPPFLHREGVEAATIHWLGDNTWDTALTLRVDQTGNVWDTR